MTKKDRINPYIKGQFEKLNISSRSYQSGEIYMLNDQKVLFPGRKKGEDKPRMVVVMGNKEHLNDPMIPIVTAAPITTSPYETPQCLPVSTGNGNLHKDSLIKAGMVQPFLKTNLGKFVGQLDPKMQEQLMATVYVNLGFGDTENIDDDEFMEEADKDGSQD